MNYTELRRLIRTIAGTGGGTTIFSAEVVSVEGDTCTIDVGGLSVSDVRLKAADDDDATGLLITPTVGSVVLVADLGTSPLVRLEVIKCTRIDSIEINGGDKGGLVNIADLTAKLNDLKDKVNSLISAYNGHTHVVNTTGTAAAQSGTASATTSTAQSASAFAQADYEDTKIKH